ncbi:MAG: hypothetical protein Q9170_006359 [Blastenia crenularia]
MPNKYSHAFVLSCYEARGFISLPHNSIPSFASSDYDLSLASTENAATPPLTALPALSSDSSTTSTASSLDDPPAKLQHSATSSIVTEIYAPQDLARSPSIGPASPLPGTPIEEHQIQEDERSLASPLFNESPLPSPLPPSKSRFSSAHDFSAFVNPLPPRRRSSRHPNGKHHRDSPTIRYPTGYPTTFRQSYSSTPDPPPSSKYPRFSPVKYHRSAPRKRIEPLFETESLASLCLTPQDEKQEAASIPPSNIDVLLREHPSSKLAKPPTRPHSNIDVLPWEYSTAEPIFDSENGIDSQPHHTSPILDRYLSSPHQRFSPVQDDVLPETTDFGDPASPHLTRYLSPSFAPARNDGPLPETMEFNDPLPDAMDFVDLNMRPLSRASSFDSVAPPPIRIVRMGSSAGRGGAGGGGSKKGRKRR